MYRSGLSYSKLCELEDFQHPELQKYIRDIWPRAAAESPGYPRGREQRKQWEIVMALRTLSDFGAVHERSEVLGVAAGQEATSFWLTRHVKRVFVTDLYATPGEWTHTAPPAMLIDPEPPFPMAWEARRLVVQHMNALDLRYEDASFDGIFSSSSIEHFGTLKDVRRSVEEMVRVLKPGGVLSVSTEYRLAGPGPGLADTLLFDQDELRSLFDELPVEPLSQPDLHQSPATTRVVVDFREAGEDVRANRRSFRTYPHIILELDGQRWTSVHLAYRKLA